MKKGTIEEIFSRAKFADNPNEYKVFYRDFERIVEKTLPEFIRVRQLSNHSNFKD